MGLEQRPYIGTWSISSLGLVQHTPDALVYLNGDTALPGCDKCSGKIDIQRFLTEVSVESGTESGSASASFSLSIPLHHTESFVRDAKFLLRPGLEVHVYMRGYFPVAGLFKHLAEPKVQNEIVGAAISAGVSSAPPAPVVKEEADKSKEKVHLHGFESKPRPGPPTIIMIHESGMSNVSATEGTLLRNGTGVHYIVDRTGTHQYGDSMSTVFYHTPGFNDNSVGIEFNHAYKGRGQVIDAPWFHRGKYTLPPPDLAEQFWGTIVHVSGETGIPVEFGNVTGDEFSFAANASGNKSGVSSHRSTSGNHSDGTFPMLYCAIRDRGYGPEAAYNEAVRLASSTGADGSATLPSVMEVKVPARTITPGSREVHGDIPFGELSKRMQDKHRGVTKAAEDTFDGEHDHDHDDHESFAVERGDKTNQAQVGPSLLDEHGLAGQGVEDTVAYPYYPVFHGVVTSVTHTYSGGVNNVSVSCASMLHFWSYHNMNTNASVFGARPMNSKLKMNLVGHNFSGMHPYEIMYTLHHDTAGAADGVAWALASKMNQTAVSEVGGESLFSLNLRYWERRFSGRMARLRMHGATGELFSSLAAAWLGSTPADSILSALRGRFNIKNQSRTKKVLAQAESIGLLNASKRRAMENLKAEERKRASADHRDGLEALQLAQNNAEEGSINRTRFDLNVLEMQAFVPDIGTMGQAELFESTYESKLDIANKVCDVTGFEFFQDVDGDFVFKPPMWNLDTRGSRVYTIEDIDIISVSFTENEPTATYINCKGSHFKGIAGTGLENEWGVRGQYIDYRLVAQFGWRPQSLDIAYFNDAKSMFFAAVNRLDVHNVGVNAANVTIPLRPEMRPGYPVFIPYLDAYYYCNSFSHSHAVGGQCTTSLTLVGKRAKFYAPGLSSSGSVRGIDAIRLNNTILPQRPLRVMGPDGTPMLSGFPNVVMTLDPTDINPLYFVVGSDMEDISNPQVLRQVLRIAKDEQLLSEIHNEDGTSVYVYRSGTTVGEGGDAQPVTVLFYFQESDYSGVSAPTTVSTLADRHNVPQERVFNLMAQAIRYEEMAARVATGRDAQQREIFAKQQEITRLRSDLAELQGLPRESRNETAEGNLIRDIATAQDEVRKLAAQGGGGRRKQQDPNSAENLGVALLMEVLNRTGRVYLSNEEFQNRFDLSSSSSLLDMLSDKKAIFTDGTQPGNYRYYSASHPDREHQGPKTIRYRKGGGSVVEGPPVAIDGTPPRILMYERGAASDDPQGAKIEAKLVEGTPISGIRILNGNPLFPDGMGVATSDIMELTFSVQQTVHVKHSTTNVATTNSGPVSKASVPRIASMFTMNAMALTPQMAMSIAEYFQPKWSNLQKSVENAITTMEQQAQSGGRNVGTLPPPEFPSSISLFKVTRLATSTNFGDIKYKDNSSGRINLGVQGSGASTAQLVARMGESLAKVFHSSLNSIRRKAATAFLRSGGQKGPELDGVLNAFDVSIGSVVGGGVITGNMRKGTVRTTRRGTTVSPVFPVSDDRGYEVVGSYRYGRGVSIDPDGVFAQLHKKDVFSLLDKGLVEQILRFFVQGRGTIQAPVYNTDTVAGVKKTGPVKDTETLKGDAAARYLNDEVLRQVRSRGVTDKQLLDYGFLLKGEGETGQLEFSLANVFADNTLDGVQKIPIINAAYSLADMNLQQSGHVCDCKAAEAGVQLQAFGQEEFLHVTPSGSPQLEGLGSNPADAGVRWVATKATEAAATWRLHQDALRGQILDRQGSTIVQQFADTFGIDTGEGGNAFSERLGIQRLEAKTRTSVFKQTLDDTDQKINHPGGPVGVAVAELKQRKGSIGSGSGDDQ